MVIPAGHYKRYAQLHTGPTARGVACCWQMKSSYVHGVVVFGTRITKKNPRWNLCQLRIFYPGFWLAGSWAASQSEARFENCPSVAWSSAAMELTAGWIGYCIPRGRISTNCTILVLQNDRTYKYICTFLEISSARERLTCSNVLNDKSYVVVSLFQWLFCRNNCTHSLSSCQFYHSPIVMRSVTFEAVLHNMFKRNDWMSVRKCILELLLLGIFSESWKLTQNTGNTRRLNSFPNWFGVKENTCYWGDLIHFQIELELKKIGCYCIQSVMCYSL